jgi:hypothetical protein
MTELTARRKADRAKIVKAVTDLAAEYGYPAEAEPERDRCVTMYVRGPHGLSLMTMIGYSGCDPDTYLIHWHGVERGFRLNPRVFNGVNPYHGCKATDSAFSAQHLTEILRRRFEAIRDDSAFIIVS